MNSIRIAKAENFLHVLPKMANCHGLIELGRNIIRGVLGSIFKRKYRDAI
jgi:hypothetical protein